MAEVTTMNHNKTQGRSIGIMLILSFILGVVVYQILQGPVLFSNDYLTVTAQYANRTITSTILLFVNSAIVVAIAASLLPIFKEYNYSLAFLYLAFSIINFAMIGIDNISCY